MQIVIRWIEPIKWDGIEMKAFHLIRSLDFCFEIELLDIAYIYATQTRHTTLGEVKWQCKHSQQELLDWVLTNAKRTKTVIVPPPIHLYTEY